MAIEVIGADTANSKGTNVTPGGSANTKGSYVELSSGIGLDAQWITVQAAPQDNNPAYYSTVYVATGAASSEVDQFAFVIPYGRSFNSQSIMLPFSASSGTRVSVAIKSTNTLADLNIWAALSDRTDFGSASSISLIGETGSTGTEIDSGGTANTKGSWVELTSSTSHDINLIWVMIGMNANAVISPTNDVLVDIGTGAAASETVLLANVPKNQDTTESVVTWLPMWVPTISSGTRIAARAQSTSTDADDRKVDVAIVGAYVTPPNGGGGGETAHVFAC